MERAIEVDSDRPGRRSVVGAGAGAEGFASAMEFVLAPVLLVVAAIWVDGRLGTTPAITITVAFVAVLGTLVRAYYAYQQRMAVEERRWQEQR